MARSSKSPERYDQMLANSATAAICAGADNAIVSWNTAAENLFGHRAQDAIGRPLSIIIPLNQRAAHEAGLARAVKTGQTRLGGQSVDILALHADGTEIPVDLSLSVWFEAGRPMFGALLRDITDRYTAQQRLQYLAHCDPLTSLPNRNAMHARITAEIGRAHCSLLLLDLDGFKQVNDTLGHSVGDQLLAAVAGRLSVAVGDSGFVARLGGDEFAILLADCGDPLRIDEITSRVFESLHPPFEFVGQCIFVGTSIGIAMAPQDASDVEQLLSNADLALYSAKNEGGGIRTFFTRAMQNASEQKRSLGADLRQAMLNDEFEIWYQPQFTLIDYQFVGGGSAASLASPYAWYFSTPDIHGGARGKRHSGRSWRLDTRPSMCCCGCLEAGRSNLATNGRKFISRPASFGSAFHRCLVGSFKTPNVRW